MDYGELSGNPAPPVKDARHAVVLALSFHFLFFLRGGLPYFPIIASGCRHSRSILAAILSVRNVIDPLQNRLVNRLLLLLLRKQPLRALRHLS